MSGVLILGMHRSGTSVVARLADAAGVYLGERLFPAQEGVNERGFWESAPAVRIDEDLLLGLSSWWDDWLPFPGGWETGSAAQTAAGEITRLIQRTARSHPLWGIKDPRICRLVPVWQQAATRAGSELACIIPLRRPVEVVRSLQRRDRFSEAKACALWLRHVLDAEAHSRGLPRLFCTFDATLAEPLALYQGIGTLVPSSLLAPEADYLEKAAEFIAPELRHHTGADTCGDSELARLCEDCYELLSSAPMQDIDEEARRALDTMALRFSEARARSTALYEEQLRALGRERARYHMLWRRLRRLKSWRATAPLRRLERLLR